jgi:hypothetical protein
MAQEYEEDGQRIIRPKITKWKLKQREQRLIASAEQIPNWRLADKARRFLADTAEHLSADIPSQVGQSLDDFDRDAGRQFASVAAGGLAVRASSSALMLVSSGYVVEAGGPLRRLIEAKLHCRAICDDETGQYGFRYLQGRAAGLSKLAQKYGERQEIETLSRVAHADTAALELYERPGSRKGDGPIQEGEFSVLPEADVERAFSVLYVIAYETVGMAVVIAQVFEVLLQIPAWISGELKRLREASAWQPRGLDL